MSKKNYAVIGHPIGHTMSPFIHKRLFELSNIDAEYTVIDVAPEKLDADYQAILSKLDGFNITIPHKQAIIPLLTSLDNKAGIYGSVNTVVHGEQSKGYTTDPDGFLAALKSSGIQLAGKVVILGTGGVARTMAFEAAKAGADVRIAVRPHDILAVTKLVGEIKDKVFRPCISSCYIDRINGDFDLLINATPIGMYPNIDNMAVSQSVLEHCNAVFDAVYNPLETKLVKTAKAMGKKALGGMSMLVWQAVVSHQIWDGSTYDPKDIEQLVLDSATEMKKIFNK
ncbi:MAG TPA: shikimate dehydrogenase [Clostridiales bacterium]|nr:shikimate dehydrogenase [Clostridiales bacterium]